MNACLVVARAISANDLPAAFKYVSEDFDRPPRNKRQFHDFCEGVLKAGNVTKVQVWDLTPVNVSRPARTGAVDFRFKVDGRWGESPPNYFGRVTFTTRSMRAKSAVRTRGSPLACETMFACSM